MGELVYSVQGCLLETIERQEVKENLYNVLGRALARLIVVERIQIFSDDDMIDVAEVEA